MRYLVVKSTELEKIRKHQVRQNRGLAYDVSIAECMYESVTKVMSQMELPIAWISMEKAYLYIPEDATPIKHKWKKSQIHSCAASIFSGVFNKNEYSTVDLGDLGLITFRVEIKGASLMPGEKSKDPLVNIIFNVSTESERTFKRRLLTGYNTEKFRHHMKSVDNAEQDLVEKFPQICRRGITIINRGFHNGGFESLIDRSPDQCFQEYLNSQIREVIASA